MILSGCCGLGRLFFCAFQTFPLKSCECDNLKGFEIGLFQSTLLFEEVVVQKGLDFIVLVSTSLHVGPYQKGHLEWPQFWHLGGD